MELKNFFAQDLMGNVIPSPTVTVYQPDTTTLATGLQNAAGAALSNPFPGTGNGQVTLAAPDGDYDLKISGAGRTTTMRVRFIDNVTNSAQTLRLDLASDAAGKGSALVAFKQSGAGAVPRTLLDKARERVSVFDFMTAAEIADVLSRTPTIDVSAKIQAAFNSLRDGVLLIPGGEYLVNSDVQLLLKGQSPNEGAFLIEAPGAFFVGAGRVIVDSSKRVQINGLDMANMDLVFRGCWWSQFTNMRFKRLVLGDAAGTNFSSNYWNAFEQCQFQTVFTDPVSIGGPHNEFSFEQCSMRGNVGQGFTGTAEHAFEFNADDNCQSWKFNGGDISYHTTSIYRIGASNTSGDVEFTFDGVYFDTLLPQMTSRKNTRIIVVRSHHANAGIVAGSVTAATCSEIELFRSGRSFRMTAQSAQNLVPNGDFSSRLSVWVGSAPLPIFSAGGATVTAMDGGFSGTYLNLNQPNTASNTVGFRTRPFLSAGRATGVVVLRNAAAGTRTIQLGFGQSSRRQFSPIEISDAEWTVATLTPTDPIEQGETFLTEIYRNGEAFNVDVAYVGVTLGHGGQMLVPANSYRTIEHLETWDAPSIATGTQITQDFTVNGAAFTDFVLASFNGHIGALDVQAAVVATNTVRLKLRNDSVSTIDLASGQWRFRVWKRELF